MHDAVEGQRRLAERELGDIRADQSRLHRDNPSCAEPEKAAGTAGVEQRAQVFDLGAQPAEVTVWSAPATAAPVRHVDRERPGEGTGKPCQVP